MTCSRLEARSAPRCAYTVTSVSARAFRSDFPETCKVVLKDDVLNFSRLGKLQAAKLPTCSPAA